MYKLQYSVRTFKLPKKCNNQIFIIKKKIYLRTCKVLYKVVLEVRQSQVARGKLNDSQLYFIRNKNRNIIKEEERILYKWKEQFESLFEKNDDSMHWDDQKW